MGLQKYWQKRDFKITSEPRGEVVESGEELAFFIQRHHARRLHYDFRLELDGTLKSWAVPKGPSLDPGDKRLAVHVEDHPLSYGTFEGDIPEHQYGAGHVVLWDRGTWAPIGDPRQGYKNGSLKFELHGEKLSGKWALVRMKGGRSGSHSDKENWLLIKERDEQAKTGAKANITELRPESVKEAEPNRRRRSHGKANAKQPATNGKGKPLKKTDQTAESAVASLGEVTKRKMPALIKPQLATLASKAPEGDEWLSEIKFDGYRTMARIDHGMVKLYSRNGNDWTSKWTTVVNALHDLPVEQAWLDGEVVAIKPDGSISFQELQNAARLGKDVTLAYFIFDIPYLNGYDLSEVALLQRKALLESLLSSQEAQSPLKYSSHIQGKATEMYEQACMHGIEGIIAKQADGTYQQFRSRDWLKVKCGYRQEFVIAGYTEPAGSREAFGALLLGVYNEKGELHYAGRVGTGFNNESLKAIARQFKGLHSGKPAFKNPPVGSDARGVHWLKPSLVGEVGFAQWTDSGVVRHAAFIGMRSDKPASQIVHEMPLPKEQVEEIESETEGHVAKLRTGKTVAKTKGMKNVGTALIDQAPRDANIAGVHLTHPAKVLFSSSQVTKYALARYYEALEPWVLTHLDDRPLSIVRCPNGSEKQCFFQKHISIDPSSRIETVHIESGDKNPTYFIADTLPALIELVQLGVLELHTWGSRKGHIDQPDRLIFDLDPDEGLPWEYVTDAALLVRGLLEEIELQSFVKTTGGKGLHVVVPIRPEHAWPDIKQFTKGIAQHLEQHIPDRFVANMSKEKRKGKIFIDYLRNASGATAIAAYSTRAKPNAPISVPLLWEEVGPAIRSNTFTVNNIGERLAKLKQDPWQGYASTKQRITKQMLRLFAPK